MLPVLPFPVLIRCTLAVVLFVIGWAGCTCWVLKWLNKRSPDLSIAAGFALWSALIIAVGLLLPAIGLFHPVAYILIPLILAITGFIWVKEFPWNFWKNNLVTHARQDILFIFGLVITFGSVWGVICILLSYPVASWDAVSYHQPISLLYLQEGRYWNLPSHYIHVNFYPKSGEILTAWLLSISRWLTMANVMAIPTWLGALAAGTYILRRLSLAPGTAFFLMAINIMSPPIMLALTRDSGNVDMLQATLLLIGLALTLDLWKSDLPPSKTQIALILLATCLCPGIKASGFLLGGLLGFCLILVLFLKRSHWTLIVGTMASGIVLVLLLSSYWMFVNYANHGNPTHPITCSVGGVTFFEGTMSIDQFIGGDERLEGRTGLRAFLRSVRDLNMTQTFHGERVGGWGWHIRYLAVPIWPLAFAIALWKKRWTVATMMVIASLWLVLIPGYWWSRFSIVFVYLLPLSITALWIKTSKAHGSVFNNLLLTVWTMLTMLTGGISAKILQAYPYNDNVLSAAREKGRSYAIQQDNLTQIIQKRHGLYNWAPENLPAQSILLYDLSEAGDHLALLSRPEMNNIIRNEDWPSTPAKDADYFLTSQKKLRQHLRIPPNLQPPPTMQWSDKNWQLQYKDKWYVVYKETD